jgi:hypothetical protein
MNATINDGWELKDVVVVVGRGRCRTLFFCPCHMVGMMAVVR